MIQPLRTVHHRAFTALAVVLPAFLVLALMARRAGPGVNAVPRASELAGVPLHWQHHAIPAYLHPAQPPQSPAVTFGSLASLGEPDVLLYWTVSEPQGKSLPMEATLLDGLAEGRTIPLKDVDSSSGFLILYSLAHQSVVDCAPLERQP